MWPSHLVGDPQISVGHQYESGSGECAVVYFFRRSAEMAAERHGPGVFHLDHSHTGLTEFKFTPTSSSPFIFNPQIAGVSMM